jgi:fumarate reductase flavoprotein subunit
VNQASERDVDVVVIGSGGAGLCAALTAHDQGATRIVVAESEGVVGGSSRLSGGLVMGAPTRYQAALGIEDSADGLYHDYLQLNRWTVDAPIVRRLCDWSGPTVDWLGDLGVEFHDQLVLGGDELVPRVHVPKGSGQAIVDVLHRHCRERGIDIALGQRVDRLLVDADGVYGVAVGDDEITAHAVIVASGGFGASPDKLAEHYPSAAATEWTWYIGADGARGDAIDLGRQVGAQLTGHDRGLRLLDVGFDHVYEAFLPGWLVMVDRTGHRFIAETAPYGLLDFAVRDKGDSVFVVFDHAALHGTADGSWTKSIPGHGGRPSKHWNPDVVEMMVGAGRVQRADSLDELADALGVPAEALAGTIDRYNAGAEDGVDPQCAKDPAMMLPVATAPFYGAELRPATVCSTAYGLRITDDAEVLDIGDKPIPGLYAAGECTGNVVGAQYVGSGNNYANCTVVGRIAGAAAAARVAAASQTS